MSETYLTLEIVGKGMILPPISARECIQTLTPLPSGALRRTINGDLVWVGNGGHRKFQSTISCRDKASPAFGEIWEGTFLKVGCLQFLTLSIPKGKPTIQLEREAHTLFAHDGSGKEWPVVAIDGRHVSLPSDFPGGFLTYRPILTMIVKTYRLETDEWGLSVGWTLELEEA